MEEIKIAAVNAHDSIRLVLFQLEHLRSNFANDLPKKNVSKELNETFNVLIKTATADVYTCADFLYQIFSIEDMDSLKILIDDFESIAKEIK